MDERCERNCDEIGQGRRCRDCGHVAAVHGYDGICDLCALKRSIPSGRAT